GNGTTERGEIGAHALIAVDQHRDRTDQLQLPDLLGGLAGPRKERLGGGSGLGDRPRRSGNGGTPGEGDQEPGELQSDSAMACAAAAGSGASRRGRPTTSRSAPARLASAGVATRA